MNSEVLPYPWDALTEVPRRAVRAARAVREALGGAMNPAALAAALSSVLGVEANVAVQSISPSSAPPSRGRSVHFAAPNSAVHFSITPEAALTSALVARILERPPHLVDPDAPLTAPIRGALAALALETARRTPGGPELVASGEPTAVGDGIQVEMTLRLDERRYGLSAWAALGSPTNVRTRVSSVGELGELPLSVLLVAAASTARASEITNVSVGDVWLPGEGWFCDSAGDLQSLLDRAVLAAPSGERGVEVGRSEDGKVVLLGGVVALAEDAEHPRHADDDRNMGEQKNTLEAVLLDSPVVVRVEVGTVSLSAREWAALQPGDVLETGVRIAEPVVLRIAGREVARGELVNVDGELGVRITELMVQGRSA